MSEVSSKTPELSNETFDSLHALYIDPMLTKVFAEIKLYKELLATQAQTEEEINSLMREIDDSWRLLMKETAIFTGYASFPNEQIPGGAVSRDFYDEETVSFGGVIPTPLEFAGIGCDDEPKFYDLRVHLSREGISSDGDIVTVSGSADIDEIISLDFQRFMSPERARRILENFQPDLIDAIDEALLHDTSDEGALAIRMSGLAYDPSAHDERTKENVGLALDVYTNSLLKLDTHNGYSSVFVGRVWVQDDEESKVGHAEVSQLVKADRIIWRISPEIGEDRVVPHISLYLCGSELNQTSLPLHVPASSISSLESVRIRYYTVE
jgi:hypothetical protein